MGASEGPLARVFTPMKVDPRAYMANERTLLAWLQMAALMAAAATGALSLGDTPEMRLTGALLAVPGICFTVSALITYYRRLRCLDNRVSVEVEDQRGPSLMLLLLSIGVPSQVLRLTPHPLPRARDAALLFTRPRPLTCSSHRAVVLLNMAHNLYQRGIASFGVHSDTFHMSPDVTATVTP